MSLLLTLVLATVGLALDSPVKSLDPDKALSQFVVDRWAPGDGLPQSTVRSIVQTANGYLWLATQSGLVRFNGLEFVVYDTDPAFSSINIIALAEDADGRLWAGTHDGVVILEDGIATPLGHLPPKTQVGALSQVGNAMWVGTWTSGLYRCTMEACASIKVPPDAEFKEVQSIVAGPAGHWVGTDSGLLEVKGDVLVSIPGLAHLSVSSMALDADQNLIVATREGTLVRIDTGRPIALDPSDGWPAERVRSMLLDRGGGLWLGLGSAGFMRYSAGRSEQGPSDIDLPVLAIYEDREGSVWIGVEAGGLLRFRDGAFTTIEQSAGLPTDYVTTLFEARDGTMLAGTFGGGVTTLDTDRLQAVSDVPDLPSKNVTGVIGNQRGDLWVATIDAGVSHIRDGRVASVRGLPSQSVYALHVDRAGDLWVGTDEGLAHVKAGSTRVLTVDDGLGSNSIVDIEDDGAGRVWVGTYGGGLTELRADGTHRTYSTENGLGSDVVAALHYDADGTLWIGTMEGGLNTLVDGALANYSLRDGLFDHTVFQILEDDLGYLWMGSNKGISRVEKSAIRAYSRGELDVIPQESFGTDDGLKSAETNGGTQPAGWKSSDGRLWFPTVAGVAVVDPGDLSRNAVPPPVVIERIEADGLPVDPFEFDEITLPSGTRRIEFKFAGLSLVEASAVKYRYRLEGEESEWNSAMAGNTATYTFLSPGSYTFHVVAANNDGVWNEVGASVSFYLRPYFWETRWFWMLVASAGFLAGAAFFRARTRQLKMQRLELERMVEARTRDVMAAKDQIQAQSDALRTSLREKEVLLREVHHRVKNNLQMISSLLQLQARQVDDPAMKLRFDECRDRIYSFSMVHERLYMAKDIADFDFVDYMKGLTDQLVRSHDRSDRDIQVAVNIQRHPMEVDRAIPCGLIVTEFVTNALRHAFADRTSGTISVDFEKSGGFAVLRVEDDGRGLSKNFDEERNQGLGLKLVDALVGRLKGTLSVKDRNIGGVRCEVRFPVDEYAMPMPPVAQTEEEIA